MPSVPIGVQIAGARQMHRDRDLLDGGAEILEPLGGLAHAFVDGSFRGRLLEALLDDADLHPLGAGSSALVYSSTFGALMRGS